MQPFIHDDFLLTNHTAKKLYHEHAASMPIFDFHNHLSPKEIYENKCYETLTDVWLRGDHYKWRAMRAFGVPEDLITGSQSDPYEAFLAWADTIQHAIGNPLYHWTHLELKRYFDIDETLSKETAPKIWALCNEKLRTPAYSVQNLLLRQNVKILCTTDDPADDLFYHKKLKEEGFAILVLPTFRLERALRIEKEDYLSYLSKLSNRPLACIDDLLTALKERLAYFIEAGCRISDHSLEDTFYVPTSYEKANEVFQKRLNGDLPTALECALFKSFVLQEQGKEYAKHNIVMQLHIGALRNNASRMYKALGADTGFDSQNDFTYAPQLSGLLNAMDQDDALPKTILYYLNPKDADMLASMAGNFQGNSLSIKGKVQLGSAWWLCDHKRGMEHQMEVLANSGLLSTFIGMLTDSRSFLSYSRHEYFRRILCNKIGTWVENGEYPSDMAFLGKMVESICYTNAVDYML
ncbi:MAG: glucuronate isomerase [Clostridiales bacterium]|nr:glucuronate isomerase [Clostridiales bacterium]